jgi:NADPH:quinone reductase-like Zn-dependent oxidoreductase
VVPNHHYASGAAAAGAREGVATNQASRGMQVHHESKLVKIAADMPREAAAAFSLGAQTAYSIARRLRPANGDRILVTSARSNTSLFAIQALRQHPVQLYAATGDAEASARLTALGADRVIVIDPSASALERASVLANAAAKAGGFDAVVDPFFDLHLDSAIDALKPFGTYLTCGLVGQTPSLARSATLATLDAKAVLQRAILKNLTIVGNCLGLRQDLEHALADYAAGRLQVVIDAVFEGGDAKPFLERSFNDRRRFGKVVFRYAA